MMLFAAYLAGIRVYDDTDSRVKQGAFTPIVVEFMYKRRVAEVFLDFCLAALCYYTAYRLRFEDPEEFMKNFADVPRVAAGGPGVADDGVLRRRRVPRRLAPFRHDGLAGGRARRVRSARSARSSFILYVYHYFAYSRTVFAIYGVLLLMAATLVARLVPAGRRVRAAPAPVGPARRHLRRGRRAAAS